MNCTAWEALGGMHRDSRRNKRLGRLNCADPEETTARIARADQVYASSSRSWRTGRPPPRGHSVLCLRWGAGRRIGVQGGGGVALSKDDGMDNGARTRSSGRRSG